MKWYPFDPTMGSYQKRPPEKKCVVVVVERDEGRRGTVRGYALGYRKDDKQSPQFIVPGIGGRVIAWCDCLPDGFDHEILRSITCSEK